nr:baseplate J/gp47 family protein [Anaerosolibacter carboniphilus]
MTYEYILQRMLDRVPNDVDKRSGSIIYDALAPAAAELAQVYIDLQFMENRTYADTATSDDLTRRAAERGINRKAATKAVRKGIFTGNGDTPFNVPIGSRFSGDDLNFTVIEKITDGEFKLECEVPGEAGNGYIGQLLPIEYINGLSTANMTDILIPGEDEEGDDSLRKRYFDNLDSQAFGGNVADYREKVNDLDGVGGVKVYPVWAGGGTVKLVIIDSIFNKPSDILIDAVQTAMDPVENQGEGIGLAPIGHVLTVVGADESIVDIESHITFQSGYVWADVKPNVEAVIQEYFSELRQGWANAEILIIRISQLETRILNIPGVLDVQDTKINGIAQNLVLDGVEIPVLGEVTSI